VMGNVLEPVIPNALLDIRSAMGARATEGLDDEVIARFVEADPALGRAIEEAKAVFDQLIAGGLLTEGEPEGELIERLQKGFVNFYGPDAVNPYVPLTARGAWIVTSHGAVVHDNGGYGMLGFGHGPDVVLERMAQPWVIANIMTPSFSQARFDTALRQEIGHTRGSCPFDRFICMNSGSEAVTVAARISDIRAKQLTGPGGKYEGRKVMFLGLDGAFHGRTGRPAQVSDSSLGTYRKNLKSFSERDNLVTVPANDVEALRAAFKQADEDGVFFEAMFMEPVMGEGNPGVAATRAFYDEARRLTREHGSFLLVDSIQAGLRGQGVLSIVDYPGFQDADAPDMETYSKALNAGQFPMSVLACGSEAASTYVRGVYGNTMTTNPRALEVGCCILENLNDGIRENIRARGRDLVAGLKEIQAELPAVVLDVTGTGLLLACELDPEHYPVTGFGGVEEAARRRGLGVIHGGRNALRFTPHFAITPAEVRLVLDLVQETLETYLAER